MPIWNTTATLQAEATNFPTSTWSTSTTGSCSSTALLTSVATSDNAHPKCNAVAELTAEAATWRGATSSNQGTFTIKCGGYLYVEKKIVPIYGSPVAVVDNIENLPGSAADGTVYAVRGTAANREPIDAIYSTTSSKWIYQKALAGRENVKITYVNPLVGTNIVMPDYINFGGLPHTPKYWSVTPHQTSFNYTMEQIETTSSPAVVPGVSTIWKWRVEDLSDPGDGKYSLNEWRESSGTGPTLYSKSWYRPQVKNATKFNIKKNKTRKQRCVAFNNSNVDHMWMQIPAGGWSQPFTVIFVGVILQYPTAKFGHYLLDTGGELPVYKLAATQGKDYFVDEGKSPRNGMLVYRRSGRMGCSDPFISGPSIKIKHNEKPRPRVWFGVFNGSNSAFGFKDTKYKAYTTGTVGNYGAHQYFVIGRRTNRISDNRASKLQLWEMIMINRALTKEELDGLYQELANKYQFKKYT